MWFSHWRWRWEVSKREVMPHYGIGAFWSALIPTPLQRLRAICCHAWPGPHRFIYTDLEQCALGVWDAPEQNPFARWSFTIGCPPVHVHLPACTPSP